MAAMYSRDANRPELLADPVDHILLPLRQPAPLAPPANHPFTPAELAAPNEAAAAASGVVLLDGRCCVAHRHDDGLAIDETVILMTPLFIPVETPNTGTGGCSRMTVSPTATMAETARSPASSSSRLLDARTVEIDSSSSPMKSTDSPSRMTFFRPSPPSEAADSSGMASSEAAEEASDSAPIRWASSAESPWTRGSSRVGSTEYPAEFGTTCTNSTNSAIHSCPIPGLAKGQQ